MKTKKQKDLRIVVHVSTYKKLKGEKLRTPSTKVYRHTKGSNVYSTQLFFGDKQIVSRKIYLPASLSDQENTKNVNKYVSKYFHRFKKTASNDFTVSAQYFKGDVVKPFRAGISNGKVSKGAHINAFKMDVLKKQIARLNVIRRKRGRKTLKLEKVLEGTLSNIRTDLATEIKGLERQTTSPTDKRKGRNRRTKKRTKKRGGRTKK